MSQEPWKTDQMVCQPVELRRAPSATSSISPSRSRSTTSPCAMASSRPASSSPRTTRSGSPKAWRKPACIASKPGCRWCRPATLSAIKEIVKRNLGPQIFAFSRCMVDDVKRAVDCGVSGIVMEVPSSQHIIQYAYQWPLERAIELSIESTAYAHSQGLEVVFFPIDFTAPK